jgi:N-acetylmuramoyl-L-alanine amidase
MKLFRNFLVILLAIYAILLCVKTPTDVSAQSNLNPIGCMDAPANGSTVKGQIGIRGWFLDGNGVSTLDVLVDGTVTGQAVYNDSRPDVQNAYPAYNNGNSGYHYTLDTTKLSDGIHTIAIRETGANGRVTALPASTVTVANVKGYMDTPLNGKTLIGTTTVSGWLLDESGIASLDVLVDGVAVGQALSGDARPDILKAFPNYSGSATAGYHFDLDTTKFSDGQHTIAIRETGKNGHVTTLPSSTVTIANVKGYMDNPVSGKTLIGTQNVSGWFLDGSGIASLDVLVDGVVAGQASSGDARPDILKAFPDYSGSATAGYHFALDTTKFKDGQHTVAIRETGKNGHVTTLPPSTVTFANANVRGYLDSPVTGKTLIGTKNVSGWFLDQIGVASIDVLVDGNIAGQAYYGDDRPDIQKAFPDYSNAAKSGYHFALDTTKFSDGQHTVTIRETGKNGQVTTLPSSTITIANVRGYMDNPISGTTHSGKSYNVSGWFLDESGVANIDVLIDGVVVGQASTGDARPDIQKAFPDYSSAQNAGYHYALDTSKFSEGPHKIAIRETGNNGHVTTLSEGTFSIVNIAGSLDYPISGNSLKGTKNVSGWFYDVNGVSSIDILVDGTVAGQATYGDGRPDVQNVFPDFDANTGYHFALDTTIFSDGQHTITVRETDKNGHVTTLPTTTVTFNQRSKIVFLDPGHGGTDPGAIGGGYREADLNLADALKVKAILESRGYTVYMSRTTDTFVSLLDRSAMANNLHADIFVSIHQNSSSSTSPFGIESFYYQYDPAYPSKINAGMDTNPDRIAKSITLASIIQQKMVAYTGDSDHGITGDTLSVVRESAMPATLLEVGYISNPSERQNLISDSYQNILAKAIADGIDQYFRSY